jgi:N-acetyl-alpha-D-muramate 1-phosphate uridylyltransferase
MILAAGRGERMGVLTDQVPKPLLELGGEPLIVRHIRALAAAGIVDLVINLSYRGRQIRQYLGDGSAWKVRIRYSEEGEPPLETAGGIVRALPLLGEQPFAVISSDVVCNFDFGLLKAAVPGSASAPDWGGTLVMVDNPPHHRRGDFVLEAGGLLAPAHPRTLTYAGIGVFHPSLFTTLPAGRRALRPVLLQAMARGALHGLYFDGLWVDAGTPQRLEEARAALVACAQK